MTLVVTGVADPAPGIRGLTLAATDGSRLPGFIPGSHLVVRVGGRANAYSLTSDGFDPAEYAISVLRVADGRGGSRLLHTLAVGETLSARPPRSAFPPIARAAKHLLVAGGIGVTPILSHLRAARRWGREVQVLYTFRAGHGAHVPEVADLGGSAAELITDRAAFTQRLTAALTAQPLGTHLYVCGPPAMIDYVVAAAATAGWPRSRIHFERFRDDALGAGEPFTVALTESGRTVAVPSGTSLLDALETSGIRIPSLCRQGVCGECRTPLGGGLPIHRDLYLSDREKESGAAIMPCVSRARGGTVLEVPL
ncbi:PDR/VanB family oxidoreductase [Nocardia sp. NPDC024068]|uniref:PDR/VanB family oxidoreductase n=1 Tax=Nocardia sp. NPDC024068 TaxID=3157197 RepID=UPI00340488ED